MGGLITTAARLKDGKVVSFRGYTNNDFNLVLNQDDFIKKMKSISKNIKIRSKRKYIKLDFDQVINKFEKRFSDENLDYIVGNNFLAPCWYGMNFFDYQNNVAFSVNDYSSNLYFLTYNLMYNPILIKMIKEKIRYKEKDLIKLSNNTPSIYLEDFFKFKELKNINALYSEKDELLDFKEGDTFEVILSLFENGFIKSEYFKLKVKHKDWDFHSYDFNSVGFDILKNYLCNNNLLTKNDKIAWSMFEKSFK